MSPLSNTIVAILVITTISRFLWQAYLSPLARVPSAHRTAPFSKIWLIWLRYTGKEHRTRYLLHQQKGPVIRLGPQELSINCIEHGVSTVYNGGFDKSEWFLGFNFYNQPFMFTMLSTPVHAERKRMLSSVYSKSHVQNSAQLTAILDEILLNRLLPKARAMSREGKAADLYKEMQALSMDVASCYVCGLKAGSNFVENVITRDFYLRAFKSSVDGVFWHEFPRIAKWAARLGIPLVPAAVGRAQVTIEELCSKMCEAAYREMKASSLEIPSNANWPVVYAHLRPKLEKIHPDDPRKVDALLAAEMLDHMIAGNDGAGNTLSFLTWQLSHHKDVQQALRRELTGLEPSAQAIDNLPLLDAILMETMRLHPAGLGPHLRIVPEKGARLGPYVDLPGGTTVSATAWALHRNEEVFPHPEEWNPRRWMDESKRNAMHKWFFGFGVGNRMCIGNHLAIRVIKTYAVAVYSNFETSLVDDVEIGQVDGHMGRPSDDRMLVHFHELKGTARL